MLSDQTLCPSNLLLNHESCRPAACWTSLLETSSFIKPGSETQKRHKHMQKAVSLIRHGKSEGFKSFMQDELFALNRLSRNGFVRGVQIDSSSKSFVCLWSRAVQLIGGKKNCDLDPYIHSLVSKWRQITCLYFQALRERCTYMFISFTWRQSRIVVSVTLARCKTKH